MVQGLCYCQVNTIIEIRLGDTDTDSYKYEPMAALLARREMTKKDKHVNHYHNQQNI